MRLNLWTLFFKSIKSALVAHLQISQVHLMFEYVGGIKDFTTDAPTPIYSVAI